MKKWMLITLTIALPLAACSPDEAASTTSSTAESTTTTAAPATTTITQRPTTTTTVAPSTTTNETNLLAEGSGCTPGTDVLGDGVWYGIVASYDTNGISFDLACWFSGDAAVIASAEDGEESPPPNDYYVRNLNTQLRDLNVGPDTPVRWYLSGDPNEFVDGPFSDWIAFLDSQEFRLGIWVTITDGEVTDIEEKWVP
ncbi:MAG: hypothetical protein WBM90_03905 [Acidimicrobiia bacterium]